MAIFNTFQALVGVAIVYIANLGFNKFKDDVRRRTTPKADTEDEWGTILSQFSYVAFCLTCLFYLLSLVGGIIFMSISLYWLFPIEFTMVVHESSIRYVVAILITLLVCAIYKKAWQKFPKVAQFDAKLFEIALKERDYPKPRKYMVRAVFMIIVYLLLMMMFSAGGLVVTLLSGGA